MAFISGISYIGLAPVSTNGQPAQDTDYEEILNVKRGSVSYKAEEAQKEDLETEQQDDPIATILKKPGKKTFEMVIYHSDVNVLKKLMGGEVSSKKWDAPKEEITIERSLKIISRVRDNVKGVFTIHHCEIKCDIENLPSAEGVFTLKMEVTRKAFTNASGQVLSPMSFEEVAA